VSEGIFVARSGLRTFSPAAPPGLPAEHTSAAASAERGFLPGFFQVANGQLVGKGGIVFIRERNTPPGRSGADNWLFSRLPNQRQARSLASWSARKARRILSPKAEADSRPGTVFSTRGCAAVRLTPGHYCLLQQVDNLLGHDRVGIHRSISFAAPACITSIDRKCSVRSGWRASLAGIVPVEHEHSFCPVLVSVLKNNFPPRTLH